MYALVGGGWHMGHPATCPPSRSRSASDGAPGAASAHAQGHQRAWRALHRPLMPAWAVGGCLMHDQALVQQVLERQANSLCSPSRAPLRPSDASQHPAQALSAPAFVQRPSQARLLRRFCRIRAVCASLGAARVPARLCGDAGLTDSKALILNCSSGCAPLRPGRLLNRQANAVVDELFMGGEADEQAVGNGSLSLPVDSAAFCANALLSAAAKRGQRLLPAAQEVRIPFSSCGCSTLII